MHIEALGPYRIGRKLGRGGMGTVYVGTNIETGDAAAIKILTPSLAQEEGFRERFSAEIETLKKLRHPHIVTLLGFGEQEGHLFYAMELVEGTSLEDELRAGRRFGWREVTRIAMQTCSALKHAHDRGVIHRDIKPANLLLTADGEVKLSDFGIAKMFGNTRMTGGVVGTAEYMAPEQADGRPVTPRCDLYSLGGVMYALLAGRPPFRAKSLPEMLHRQRFAEPDPVRRYAADVPDELGQLIAQLLAKNPDQRVANAQVLSRRLSMIEQSLSIAGAEDSDSALEQEGLAAGVTSPDGEAIDLNGQTMAQTPRPGFEPLNIHEAPTAAPVEFEVSNTGKNQRPASMAAAQPGGSGHFVRVERSDLDPDDLLSDNTATNLFSLQTLGLVLAMLALGGGAWYFLQPPSAGSLYARVEAKANSGDIERLLEAEDDINVFLARHARDPRARKMEDWRAEIELERMQRKLERRARSTVSSESLTPVERAYVDAIRYLRIDQERGRAMLRALVDIYDVNSTGRGPTEQCLELARRELKNLDEEVQDFAGESLALLEARLEAADQLADSDPAAARKIRSGVAELYEDKAWAAPAVERARKALVRMP